MQKVDNIGLCLDVTDIKAIGVSIHTAEKWSKIKDPNDRRRDLYPIKDLYPKYQLLAKEILFKGLEAGEFYLKSQIINWLPQVPQKDKEAIEKFRIAKRKDDYTTGEILNVDKEGLPTWAKTHYLLEVRWILLMKDGFTQFKKNLKSLDINSKEQFRRLCITIANANGMKFGGNMVAIRRDKFVKYENQGIVGIISKKWGNTCAEKVTEECLQMLINLFGDRTKPSTKKVTKAYNRIAIANGWEEVTEQTVFNRLNKPEVKQAWTLGRHGYEVWKRDYQYTGSRFRATLPNALWIGDDTKVNLFYMDKKGLRAHLQVYAIVDSHSGYWLGRTYAESKKGVSVDAEDVKNCFADSVVKSGGYMPFQMLYDNDGANNFYEKLNSLHFPCMPYNGQSKYIERLFKKVQEEYMADDKAFTGMNIQSKTDQSKRVIEKGNKMAYATKEEAINAMEMWFEIMNNTKDEKTGLSPKDKYYSTINEDARKMTEYDEFEILYEWNAQPITMTKNGLKMEHNKTKLLYDIIKDDQIDISFYEDNVKRAFKVKYNPRNMSKIALYTFDERFIGIATTKYLTAEAVQDYRPDERKKIDEILNAKKEQVKNIEKRLATAQNVSNAELIIGHDMYKYQDKAAVNQAEADVYTNYYEQQAIEDEKPFDVEAERRARVRRQ